MRQLLRSEPVLVAGLIEAALVCAVAFGLPLTGEQVAALVGVATAGLVLAAAARAVVTPVEKVEKLVQQTAREVGRSVAAQLTPESVGARGQITGPAIDIIKTATDLPLVGDVLGRESR